MHLKYNIHNFSKHLNVWCVACHQTNVCTFLELSLNCPRWLGTMKGFPNAVIMAHSNSIYQQAKAITASIDFDYRLYAWMTLNLTLLHTTGGSKATFHQHKSVTSPFSYLLEHKSLVGLKLWYNGKQRFSMLPGGAAITWGATLKLHLYSSEKYK